MDRIRQNTVHYDIQHENILTKKKLGPFSFMLNAIHCIHNLTH